MDFHLTVNLDNAAFEDNPAELARILERLAGDGRLTHYPELSSSGTVGDTNGNTVGRWEISDETAPAAVHLAEMRDLAGRIAAMGNTLETRETGKPTVSIWEMARELAELVNHYEPNA